MIPQDPKELTYYLVNTYHKKHRSDLLALLDKSRRLELRENYAAVITQKLEELHCIVEAHLTNEETRIFSMIQHGFRGGMLSGPIAVIKCEHEVLDDILNSIEELTNKFISDDVDIQKLYHLILQFKSELLEHATIEDDTLFPAVLT